MCRCTRLPPSSLSLRCKFLSVKRPTPRRDGGQPVKAGGIIIRQVGSTWHEGTNTELGRDYTLFSLVDGIVIYDKKKERPSVG
jgi:large subunit ribosomal protein L27